jgi:hypothetical protein
VYVDGRSRGLFAWPRTIRQVTIPGHRIDIHRIAECGQLLCNAQHIALHAAEREILEYKESESQIATPFYGKNRWAAFIAKAERMHNCMRKYHQPLISPPSNALLKK